MAIINNQINDTQVLRMQDEERTVSAVTEGQ